MLTEAERQIYLSYKQLVLPFDFWEEEKEEEEKRIQNVADGLPHYENPANDNEYLLEAQWQFKHGDQSQLVKIYDRSRQLCLKFINMNSNKNKHIRGLNLNQKKDKAEDAATYIIEQYMKRPDFAINKNFPGYLYLRVLHELFYRRHVDRIVDFVDLARFFREGEEDEMTDNGETHQIGQDLIKYDYTEPPESEEDKEQRELRQFYLWKRKKGGAYDKDRKGNKEDQESSKEAAENLEKNRDL